MALETLTDNRIIAGSPEKEAIPATQEKPGIFSVLMNPAMRPIVLGVLVFAIFNLLFSLAVTFSPLNKKFNFSYGNFLPVKLEMLEQHQPDDLDVLFMGTSQTNNGFITSVFEEAAGKQISGRKINSFNLGLPNNRYDVMLGYLQMHVQKYGKPRVLLLELSPSIQEKDAYLFYLPALYYRTLIEKEPSLATTYLSNPLLPWNVKQELLLSSGSSLYQYRYTFAPVNILGKVSGKLKSIGDRILPAAHANNAIPIQNNGRDPFAHPAINPMSVTPEMTEKGWYPKEQSPHMLTASGLKLSLEEARKYYIDQQKDVNFEKLSALLAYCKQQNIPVVLVSWPNHPAFLKIFNHSPLAAKYNTGVQTLLTETLTPYINLNQNIPSWQSETEGGIFADPRHLTPEGAKLFSTELAKQVFTDPKIAKLFSQQPKLADANQT